MGRWFDERNTINGLFLAKPLGSVFELDPRVTAAEVGNIKKFNASYKLVPGVLVYGTYSEGYRPNGVNRGTAPQDGILDQSYKSDFVRNYEVGLKSQWFDNRLRFNATAYHMKWTNIQFTTLVPNVIFFVSGNAGTATDNGVEFDLSFRPIDRRTLSLNGADIEAHLTQSFCVGGPCGTARCFLACAVGDRTRVRAEGEGRLHRPLRVPVVGRGARPCAAQHHVYGEFLEYHVSGDARPATQLHAHQFPSRRVLG